MYIKYYNTIEYYKTILKKIKSISDTNNSFEIKCFVNSSGLASWTSQLDEYILVPFGEHLRRNPSLHSPLFSHWLHAQHSVRAAQLPVLLPEDAEDESPAGDLSGVYDLTWNKKHRHWKNSRFVSFNLNHRSK